ncbi:MAG: flavodoxin family protein [Eubacteriales bacterium]|nr:flavodoxin family protein [Eubacteriales bacterium]
MKVLLLNGSPRGEGSNTLRLSRAFIKGLGADVQLREVVVRNEKINPCTGCFSCWHKTPGVCIWKDDMPAILEEYIAADLVIWSFPLYYFSMPSGIKALMDRLLPLNLPGIHRREDGGNSHPARYDLSQKKMVLISTCGFAARENNFEALKAQFDILYGRDDGYTSFFMPEGELMRVPELQERAQEYLGHMEQAGREYRTGGVAPATRAALNELLIPEERFLEGANR